jgi:hypothetical protein
MGYRLSLKTLFTRTHRRHERNVVAYALCCRVLALALLLLASTPLTAQEQNTLELQTAAFVSRELVDVEYQRDDSLAILISVPGAVSPGLYRWGVDEVAPKKLCDLASPTFFSFDRNVVIERERGARSRIRLYAPHDCRLLAELDIEGRVLDIDVRGRYVAAAVRLADKQIALQLFTTSGELLTTTSVGRNVEMGFSPDGRLLVNFDLSDVGLQAWRVPQLTNVLLPEWLRTGDVTFVPGSRFVKRYDNELLTIARWPIGTALYTLPTSRALRLRQLSGDGRFGIAHELGSDRADNAEALQWIDFKTRVRTLLASGSIDNATISRDVSHAAWSLRLSGSEHRVLVQRKRLPPPIATFEGVGE